MDASFDSQIKKRFGPKVLHDLNLDIDCIDKVCKGVEYTYAVSEEIVRCTHPKFEAIIWLGDDTDDSPYSLIRNGDIDHFANVSTLALAIKSIL